MIGDHNIVKDIAITGNKGIYLNVNGYTFSIQIGAANYCDNYNLEIGSEKQARRVQSDEAEVAVWMTDNPKKWVTEEFFPDADQVAGWVTLPRILEAIAKAMSKSKQG